MRSVGKDDIAMLIGWVSFQYDSRSHRDVLIYRFLTASHGGLYGRNTLKCSHWMLHTNYSNDAYGGADAGKTIVFHASGHNL